VRCPACSGATRVAETRAADGGAALRRRRICTRCGERFTTFERREAEPLYVLKRDGRRQRFDRTKLRAALLRAAHKRPVSPQHVERMVERVEAIGRREDGELAAGRIGELCLEELRELDLGAYLQFAGTLAEPESAISGRTAAVARSGSIRSARHDSELPPKAGQRRGFDD
jgi:transcriptional repressor NrdR